MKRLLKVFGVVVLVAGMMSGVQAQTSEASHDITIGIIEIAELGLEDSDAITLTVTAPETPGDDPQGDSNSAKVLDYTSTVNSSSSRTITAAISSGTVPSGLRLAVAAANPGGPNEGASAGELDLGSTAADLITGIRSCATNSGGGGTGLTYNLYVDDPTSLDYSANPTVTVQYTLTDDS